MKSNSFQHKSSQAENALRALPVEQGSLEMHQIEPALRLTMYIVFVGDVEFCSVRNNILNDSTTRLQCKILNEGPCVPQGITSRRRFKAFKAFMSSALQVLVVFKLKSN